MFLLTPLSGQFGSSRAAALAVVLVGLCGSACGQAPTETTAEPSVRPTPAQPTAAPSPAADAPPASPPGATSPAPAPLSQTVALCAPPDGGRPWAETARADDAGNTYVMIEHAGDARAVGLEYALVLLAEGGCEHQTVSYDDLSPSSGMRWPSDDVWEGMLGQSFAWHAAQSGGAAAYAEAVRAAHGGTFVECAPAEARGQCVPTWLVRQFESAGIEVGAPRY